MNNNCSIMVEKCINPHTDFGFKRLFGSEFNKELLISFLNGLVNNWEKTKPPYQNGARIPVSQTWAA